MKIRPLRVRVRPEEPRDPTEERSKSVACEIAMAFPEDVLVQILTPRPQGRGRRGREAISRRNGSGPDEREIGSGGESKRRGHAQEEMFHL